MFYAPLGNEDSSATQNHRLISSITAVVQEAFLSNLVSRSISCDVKIILDNMLSSDEFDNEITK